MRANKIARVTVRQRDAYHTALRAFQIPVEASADGQAYAVITPVLLGTVRFTLNADFTDYASSAGEFTLHVAPPEEAPARFWADNLLDQFSHGPILRLHVGETYGLQPGVTFASAPDQRIWLKGGVTFDVRPAEGAPVASVDANGTVTGLRPGVSMIDVTMGKFKASAEVRVSAP